MRGKKDSKFTFTNVFMAIIALAVVVLAINQTGILSITPADLIDKDKDGVIGLCQDDGDNNLKAAAKNPLNSSKEYQAASFVVVVNDEVVTTGTGTAGASITHTSLAVPCYPRTGTLYALATADLVSAKGTYEVPMQDTTDIVVLAQADSAQAELMMRDTALANTSDTFASTQTETTAVAMSSGETRNGYIDIRVSTGKAQYGGPETNGLLWVIDTVDSAAFGEDDISISSAVITLKNIDCGDYDNAESKDSADRCYVSSALKASDGEKRLSWTMSNNGGSDAGASSDPILYVEDLQYYEETDGSIQYGAFTNGGTNVGETQVKLTWAIS